jgi:chemotaxis protein methyltransferase CheR
VDDIASGIVALRTPTAKHVPTTARAHAADGIGGSATTHLPGHEFGPNCVDPARMERDLTKEEFRRYHDYLYAKTGIHYPDEKIELLSNRIRKRLRATSCAGYDAYLTRIQQRGEAVEQQAFFDSITTNETYFFRCQRHWDFFKSWAQQRHADAQTRKQPVRVWSAASSTGAEAFTALIVLQQVYGPGFGGTPVEVFGTDLSQAVLAEAQKGVFSAYALSQTPPDVVKKHFAKVDKEDWLFDRELAKHATFARHNLMEPLLGKGLFDFVFVRNVLIYFDGKSRERVLTNCAQVMQTGAPILVGESESLMGTTHPFTYVKPSIFVKPATAAGAGPTAPAAGAALRRPTATPAPTPART